MSRLNPHANTFSATGGRNTRNANLPPTTPPHHTTQFRTTQRATDASAATTTRVANEIDLSQLSLSNSSSEINAWSHAQPVQPSPTAPRYGHSWNSTFPTAKRAASQSNLNILHPRSPGLTMRRPKSPSMSQLKPPSPFQSPNTVNQHFGANGHRHIETLPAFGMMRQPANTYKNNGFEPFGDEDALLQEAVNAGSRLTSSPQTTVPVNNFVRPQFEPLGRLDTNVPNVFSDEDEETGLSRNGVSSF